MRSLLWRQVKAWFASWFEGIEDPINPDTLPLMDRCRYLYQHLNLEPFTRYRQTNGHGRSVTVVHANIDSCVKDLIQHINNLERAGHVLDINCNYNAIKRPINRFFVTSEGFYQESLHGKLVELCGAVVNLCDGIDEAKHVEYETKTYNLRMLNSLLTVLLDFGFTLEEISAEIQNQL